VSSIITLMTFFLFANVLRFDWAYSDKPATSHASNAHTSPCTAPRLRPLTPTPRSVWAGGRTGAVAHRGVQEEPVRPVRGALQQRGGNLLRGRHLRSRAGAEEEDPDGALLQCVRCRVQLGVCACACVAVHVHACGGVGALSVHAW